MQMKSDIFRTEPSAYIKEIVVRWFARNIWWFVAVIAVCIALAFIVDTAFIFVASMIVCIVIPFVLAFVYYGYGLRPSSTRWFLPRMIEVTDRGLCIRYMPDERFKRLPADEFLPIGLVAGLKIGERNDVVYLGSSYDDFIIVSADAFAADTGLRAQFHEYIYQSIQRNCVNLHS